MKSVRSINSSLYKKCKLPWTSKHYIMHYSLCRITYPWVVGWTNLLPVQSLWCSILFGTIIIYCQCTFLATPCVFPSQKNHLLFLCNQLLGILQKYVIMLKVALSHFLLGLFFQTVHFWAFMFWWCQDFCANMLYILPILTKMFVNIYK